MFSRASSHVVQDAVTSSLAKLKVNDLKTIAGRCGITASGKKADLCSRLDSHFESIVINGTAPTSSGDAKFDPESSIPKSILSFDVGYKNLAHVKLDCNNTITEWCRTDLQLENFHPSASAPIMRSYVHELILPALKDGSVKAIVMEQQRYRENGGHNVFEHTIRVNTIEAMLWYALYEAIGGRQLSSPYVVLEAVSRPAVDRMWRADWEQVTPPPPPDSTKAKMNRYKKLACVKLVKHWLEEDKMVRVDRQELWDNFIQEKKQDDMADCLLQAMSWYRWRHSALEYMQQCLEK
ncbi:ribonuclease H-like domain-containing protein [Zychaea mexicana]|uniref:ribonuclease H-like domain-containing protein n=1 Tax=Zychaea mexicana TaxID=64656 RepID=UPI0022FEF1F3|nr:ribonuclease H-like domain-containing protein [Zychaea mexicana]KAI9496541.1 ribonuclease H-like domain-containing protein [Zychaea mexicana]